MDKNIVLILILSFASFAGNGQTKNEIIKKGLSLEDALQIAQKRQPDYLNAVKNTTILQQAIRGAKAGYLPQIQTQLSMRNNFMIPTTLVPIGKFNPQYPGDSSVPIQFGTRWSSAAAVSLSQVIFDAQKLVEIKSADMNKQLAATEANIALKDLEENVTKAYYSALLSKAQITYTEKNLSAARENFNYIQKQYNSGKVLLHDVTESKLEYEEKEINIIKSKGDFLTAKQMLIYTIGIDSLRADQLHLNDSLAMFLKDTGTIFQQALPNEEQILSSHSGYRKEQLSYQLNKIKLQEQKSAYLPTVGLDGALGTNYYDQQFTPFQWNKWYGNSYIGLSLQWNIFDGGARSSNISQAKIQLQQDQNTLRKYRENLSYNLVKAQTAINTCLATLYLRYQQLQSSLENVPLIKARFAEGRALPKEILDAENDVEQAQYQYLQSIYDYLNAKVEWNRVIGEDFK